MLSNIIVTVVVNLYRSATDRYQYIYIDRHQNLSRRRFKLLLQRGAIKHIHLPLRCRFLLVPLQFSRLFQ
jgi:hypothetical protein